MKRWCAVCSRVCNSSIESFDSEQRHRLCGQGPSRPQYQQGWLSGMQFTNASKDKSTGDQVKISYLFSKRLHVFLPDPVSQWRYVVSSLARDINTNQNRIFHIPFNNSWHPEACCLPMMMQDVQKSLQQSLRVLFSHFHNYTLSNIITSQSYLKMYTQIFNDDISEVMCGIKVLCTIRLQQGGRWKVKLSSAGGFHSWEKVTVPRKQWIWVTDHTSAASPGTLLRVKSEKRLQPRLSISEVSSFSSPVCFPSTCLALVSPEEPVHSPPLGHVSASNLLAIKQYSWGEFFNSSSVFLSYWCFKRDPWRDCIHKYINDVPYLVEF